MCVFVSIVSNVCQSKDIVSVAPSKEHVNSVWLRQRDTAVIRACVCSFVHLSQTVCQYKLYNIPLCLSIYLSIYMYVYVCVVISMNFFYIVY